MPRIRASLDKAYYSKESYTPICENDAVSEKNPMYKGKGITCYCTKLKPGKVVAMFDLKACPGKRTLSQSLYSVLSK